MNIGFTGTQIGMTEQQKQQLSARLLCYTIFDRDDEIYFHHGDCIGADAQAHDIAKEMGQVIVIHPPNIPSKRAWKLGDVYREPAPYLVRNHDIVDETDILIATPKGDTEELRSGTWSTVRYARKCNKKVIIIYPSGECEDGNSS